MSLSSAVSRNDYVGNGNVDTYAYSFRITDQSHLRVIITDLDGVETELVITTDFTVTGVGASGGGNVVLVNSAQAWLDGDGDLKSGYGITVIRSVPVTQLTDIRNQGDFFPEVHENAFDKLTMIAQQQEDAVERSAKMPISVPASEFDPTFPSTLVDNPGKTVMVNDAGDGFELGPDIADLEAAQAAIVGLVEDAEDARDAAVVAQTAAESAASDASDSADDAADSAADAAAILGQQIIVDKTANYSLLSTDNGKIIRVDSTSGAFNITAIAGLSNGFRFKVIDKGGLLETNAVTFVRDGSQKIQSLSANYAMEKNFGVWEWTFDGTDWHLTSGAKNLIRKTFYGVNQNWTAPGHVKKVRVSVVDINAWDQIKAGKGSGTTGGSGYLLNANGDLYSLGANANGQLGHGDVVPKSSPVAVLGGLTFKKISASQTHALMLDANGNAYAMGANANGQLGLGDVTPRSSPVAVLGGLTFTDVQAGLTFSLFLTAAGAAYACGINTNGQLGLGDVTPRSSPVAVLGGLVFTQISAGTQSSAGVAAGAGYSWGFNEDGQLGHGNVTPKSSPVAILGGLTFSKVVVGCSATSNHMLGMTTTGVGYGWGENGNGQLALGDLTPRSSPIAILGGLTLSDIDTGTLSSQFLASNGVLYGAGNGPRWGSGNTLNNSSPVAVPGGLTVAQIGMGGIHGHILTTAGLVYGYSATNANGEVGDGTVTPRSSPVAVLVLNNLQLRSMHYNEAIFDVTPGTTYAIKSLGQAAIDTTIYKLTAYKTQVTLEYEA